jgi:hypothetical protein
MVGRLVPREEVIAKPAAGKYLSAMGTIVFQSFRDERSTAMARCLASVEAWAKAHGYAYRFLDDALFERVPDWFRERVAGDLLPMSDLARLVVARELLDEGWDTVAWLDADVLVFDPKGFNIDIAHDYAFCREVWLRRSGADKLLVTEGLHNAVCVFARDNPFLDFYIHACESIIRDAEGPIRSHALGPDFLARMADVIGPRTLPDVGLFSPIVTAAIAKGGGRASEAYRKAFGNPVRCANLCLSFVDRESSGVTLSETILDLAIDRLMGSGGKVLNEPHSAAGA